MREQRYDIFVQLFFATCLAVNLWAVHVGWSNSLRDPYRFRQTQTALSTFWLLQGRPWLAYETPVLGPPWSIPLEFPLYQWTVVCAVRLLAVPLDQAGRLVSLAWFYLSLPAAYSVLGRLGVRSSHRFAFLGLWLISPEYIFWSRTFMIESTALCLSLWYLAASGAYLERPQPSTAVLAALCGALAAMVKGTTFPGFALAAAFLALRPWRHGRLPLKHAVVLAAAAWGIPFGMAILWTHAAETLRAANPLASTFLISTDPRWAHWNFGALAMRWDSSFWAIIVRRAIPDAVGHFGVLAVCAEALVLAPRRSMEFGSCLLLFLLAPLVFANLHFVHNYYGYANALFLLSAVGFAIVSLLEQSNWRRPLGATLLIAVALIELGEYLRGYHQVQRRDPPAFSLASLLQEVTDPSDVLLIYGQDWCAEIPYYARRRALMDRDNRSFDEPVMRGALANLKGDRIGAGIFCGDSQRQDLIRQAQEKFQLQDTPFVKSAGCDVYLTQKP